MSNGQTRGVVIVVIVTCGIIATALAEPANEAKSSPRPAGPGPVHQQMAKRAGQWTLTKKLSMPGQQPMTASGSATITSILGGRFLREENSGMLFGQPVAAEMISGYNDETDKYEIVWGWTGANRLIAATGTSNRNRRVLTVFTMMNELGRVLFTVWSNLTRRVWLRRV